MVLVILMVGIMICGVVILMVGIMIYGVGGGINGENNDIWCWW